MTDQEYQRRRNLLIPLAENHADQACGRRWTDHRYKSGKTWGKEWNRVYIAEMDRLWTSGYALTLDSPPWLRPRKEDGRRRRKEEGI